MSTMQPWLEQFLPQGTSGVFGCCHFQREVGLGVSGGQLVAARFGSARGTAALVACGSLRHLEWQLEADRVFEPDPDFPLEHDKLERLVLAGAQRAEKRAAIFEELRTLGFGSSSWIEHGLLVESRGEPKLETHRLARLLSWLREMLELTPQATLLTSLVPNPVGPEHHVVAAPIGGGWLVGQVLTQRYIQASARLEAIAQNLRRERERLEH
jgi:hypothetical protein